jgi:hypothetical protein
MGINAELLSRLYKLTTQEVFECNIEALRLFCEKHKHGRFWNEYFFKTWIKKFHLTTWSMVGEKDPDARRIHTNNFAESWNNHLKHVTFEGSLNLGLDKVCDGLHQSLRTATININRCACVRGFGLELESFVPEEDEGADQNVAIPTDNGTLEIPRAFAVDFAQHNLAILDNPGHGWCQQYAFVDAAGLEEDGVEEVRDRLIAFLTKSRKFRELAEEFLV